MNSHSNSSNDDDPRKKIINGVQDWIYPAARGLCSKHGVSSSYAEDLAHDAMEKVLSKPNDYLNGLTNPDGFVYNVLQGVVLDQCKKKHRVIEAIGIRDEGRFIDNGESQQGFDADRLMGFFEAHLTPTEFNLLKNKKDLDNYHDVGDAIGISEGAARVQMHRLRPKLQNIYFRAMDVVQF